MDEYDNGTYGIFKKRISIIKAPGDRSFEMSPGIIYRFILNICRALIILTCEFVP